jgi:hypothetical protein
MGPAKSKYADSMQEFRVPTWYLVEEKYVPGRNIVRELSHPGARP